MTPHPAADRPDDPITFVIDDEVLTVRPARSSDLPAVAMLHGRCSPRSLLDRYRAGGRAPSIAVLDHQLRQPLSFVVTSQSGRLVACATATPDPEHGLPSTVIGLLVEDACQGRGIGHALLRYAAACARRAGYRQLITYPGTRAEAVIHFMGAVGHTRWGGDSGVAHLHTVLSDSLKLRMDNLTPPSSDVRRTG